MLRAWHELLAIRDEVNAIASGCDMIHSGPLGSATLSTILKRGNVKNMKRPEIEISVITTLYNEETTVADLLDSVLNGTMIPDEFVIADGGSTDGTLELLSTYAAERSEIKVLTDSGGRSAGRNAAIAAAEHDFIVCIDGGCFARPTWLAEITEPLTEDVEWVGGFYSPKGRTALSTAIGLTMVFVIEEVGPDFVPSARSMAFHKRLWREVGGFPEDVQYGEDTFFDQSLMDSGYRLTFAPDAIVEWRPPSGLVTQARTMFSWGRGDGLLGMRGHHYRRLLYLFTSTSALVLAGFLLDYRILLISGIPLAPTLYRQTRYKYRHMDGLLKWVLIPVATLNGLAASLMGFLAGYLVRKRIKVE
jgi:glycosyltransferase involved in cell wall biosynthesis